MSKADHKPLESLQKDNTAQKRAKAVLKERDGFLINVFSSIHDGIVVLDRNFHFTFWNPAMEQLTDIPSEELVGTDRLPWEIFPHLAEQGLKELMERAMRGEVSQREQVPYRLVNGKEGFTSETYYPLKTASGDTAGIVCVVHNITEHRNAEQALRAEQDRAQTYLDIAATMILALDAQGRVTLINKKGCEILGYPEAEIVGKDWFENFLPQRLRAEVARVFKMLMKGKMEPVEYFENPVLTKSGEEREIAWHNVLIKDSRGGIIGTLSAAEDITERKRSQQLLEATMDELKRSNTELDQFASIVTHDLQEPLRAVTGFSKMLAEQYRGKLDRTADEFIQFIVEGGERMQQLILDLLAYSRVTTRGREFRPVDFESIIKYALNNLLVAIEENSARITHDPLPIVMADEIQMVQLLQNLIANSIRFRGKEPPQIHISEKKKKNEWLFSVKDNGIGIDPDHSERVFQIFQRLHSQEKYPGRGIGLAVCRKIVERHKGKIYLDSEPDKGATVYFTLPKT